MKQTDVKYQTPEYPRQIRLDTTNFCNATCKSCHRFLSQRKGNMPIEMINRVLDDVSRWKEPLSEVIPVNYGEFFLRNNWQTILSMISHKLPKTQITLPTNGSKLNSDVIRDLCKIPTVKLLNFSINGFFDETYEAFMGLPASNIANIEKSILQVKAQRPDIKTWASMVFDPIYQADAERDYFVSYWKNKVDTVWTISASSAARPEKQAIIPRLMPCRSIFSDLVIGYDGKLSSCCWDSSFSMDLGYYSGNAHADWHNPKLEALRRLHNEGRRQEDGLCKNCTSA